MCANTAALQTVNERPVPPLAFGWSCAPFYIPGFRGQRTLTVHRRVYTVMHETTHSAVVPGGSPAEGIGIDIAYARTRLFGALREARHCATLTAYVMTLLALARTTGGAPAIIAEVGIGPSDTFRLTTPAGEPGDLNRTARRAIGYAGSWLNYAAFWSPDLYDFIAASLATWSASGLAGNGSHRRPTADSPATRVTLI
jgi:hypothetical protein